MALEIAVLGDVHDDPRLQGALALLGDRRPDLVLLTGDLGLDPPRSSPAREAERAAHDASVRKGIAAVATSTGAPVVFVPGNHDLPDPGPDTGGVNCDGRCVEQSSLTIAGLGGAGPGRFGFPYEWSEREADRALRRTFGERSDSLDIFLSHTPPRGTALDRTHHGFHVGSQAVRKWIERVRPRLFVCGHIHEAWGVETVAGAPCINAGSVGEPFGQEIAWRVVWENGPQSIRSFRRLEDGTIETREWSM